MGFLSDLFTAAASMGRAVLGVVAPAVGAVVRAAKRFIDDVVTEYNSGTREEPKTAREHIERELHTVNEELVRLQLAARSAELNEVQSHRLRYLRERRISLNEEISNIDQVLTAQAVVEDEKHYKPIEITDKTAHILQYHVGQSTHNKLCRNCGSVMLLQWKRAATTAGKNDFFWGCSDFYNQHNGENFCRHTERLTIDDLNLFANMNRPEFDISADTLTKETINPVKARRIRQALDSIKDKQQSQRLGLITYRCPVHGESLRLRRKNQPEDHLFDEYFLGCPMWLPGGIGCNFLIKLKSAAQISSVLDSEQQQGVLGL
jgi:hypothetical protein